MGEITYVITTKYQLAKIIDMVTQIKKKGKI